MKRKMFPTELDPPLVPIYRVSQKKTGISLQGSFEALKWPKIKKSKKTNPT